MLLTLDIADFVLVDRLSLEVPHGFSTFTGETGAGKSILVDALALLLGGRADAGIVREGAARAEVAGTFDAAGLTALQAWCDAQGCPVDDGVVVLRRVVDAQGRSRAWINGRTATVAQLREAGEHLVEIHGQHEHQALVRPAGQRAILDAHAGAAVAAADVETAWQAWRDAHAARVAAESDATRFAEERERLRWQRDELEPLALAPEAWADLQADHARLAHAAALIDGVEAAVDALTEADDAVVARLARVRDGLDSLVAHESALGDVVAALDAAQIQCDEGARALRHVRARLEIDPERLAEVDARLQAVVAGARRFRVAPEALQAHVADLDARIAALEAASDPQQLARSEADALARWQHAAAALTALRTHAARTLEAAVTDAMQTLAMGGGAFAVRLEPVDAPSAQGAEAVVFAVRGHAGGTLAPLAKVASGGELARLSLAIRTVTASAAPVPTLVFDEVDSGVGGAVAEVVGRRLAALGESRQVLCITHLPQVAARAGHQWQVSKVADASRAASRVASLDRDGRIEEIARMLGGVQVTATTRRLAREMLDGGVSG